jgi:hypothetical protein
VAFKPDAQMFTIKRARALDVDNIEDDGHAVETYGHGSLLGLHMLGLNT